MSDDAIPAATLIVMRDRIGDAPELLMVTRSSRMAFAAGAMVFPGGRIDEADWALGGDHENAAKVAAIRETIEETGLHVGVASQSAVDLQPSLHAGDAFGPLLERHGARLELHALVPFARWKPTFKHTRRFDTLFFLTRAPERSTALSPQAGEIAAAEWVSASDLLRRIGEGSASAIFPTVRNLERLAQFGSFDEAAAHAAAHPVETISPWIEESEGERWLRIPDHLGYPVTRERLESAMRG